MKQLHTWAMCYLPCDELCTNRFVSAIRDHYNMQSWKEQNWKTSSPNHIVESHCHFCLPCLNPCAAPIELLYICLDLITLESLNGSWNLIKRILWKVTFTYDGFNDNFTWRPMGTYACMREYASFLTMSSCCHTFNQYKR